MAAVAAAAEVLVSRQAEAALGALVATQLPTPVVVEVVVMPLTDRVAVAAVQDFCNELLVAFMAILRPSMPGMQLAVQPTGAAAMPVMALAVVPQATLPTRPREEEVPVATRHPTVTRVAVPAAQVLATAARATVQA